MRNQKLIFIDLDGTLLDSNRFISDYSKQVLHRLRAQGDIVCIASGRPYGMLRLYVHELQITTPVISNNGANVYLPIANRTLCQTFLPIRQTQNFLSYCRQYNLDCAALLSDAIFTGNTPERLARYGEYNTRLTAAGFPPLFISVLNTPEEIEPLLSQGVERLSVLIHSEQDYEHISSYFETAAGLKCIRSTMESFDIIHPDVDKWYSILFIADYYGISLSDVYTFGNDRNDLTMIKKCQNSFAVKNGEAEVLKNASHIIDSNDQDGVAKAIEKYLL